MKNPSHSLKARLAIGLSFLILLICAVLVGAFDYMGRANLLEAAQARQLTSLRILVDKAAERFDGLQVTMGANGGIEDLKWDDIPDLGSHDMIDSVGAVSGETATVFGWDAEEGDFIRLSTNIIKPDGTRAVGTYLGRENPVFSAMQRKETFRGEAVILGLPYFTVYEPIHDAAGDVIGIFYVGVDRSVVEAHITEQRVMGLSIALVAIGSGILALFLMLSRSLRPFNEVSRRLESMAGGDLDTVVPHLDRKDEMGGMARIVEQFRLRLSLAGDQEANVTLRREQQERVVQALRSGLERLAARDLKVRITDAEGADFPQEYEVLRQDFNAGIESLANAMDEVGAVALGVRGAASEIGSTSDDLARRVEEQAATLEKSAASLDALAGTGREIAANAETADKLAGSSQKLSAESEEVLRRAIAAIARIEEASGKINQIITAIDDIAFQTNLLALNAGVEAARAGEAGKGFAVVASEVRSLAQTAAEAAQEIKTLIRASNDEVREGSNLVQQTGVSLGQMLVQVDKLGTLISDIAGSVRSQTDGLSEINEGVQRLEGMTQHNAAVVEELNAAGQSLNAEAHRLSDTLSVFQGSARDQVMALEPSPKPVSTAVSPGWEAEIASREAERPEVVVSKSSPVAATGTDDGWDDF